MPINAVNRQVANEYEEPNTPEKMLDWLHGNSIAVLEQKLWKDNPIFVLKNCPWDQNHEEGSAFIIVHHTGTITAGCRDKDCRKAGRNWRELRQMFEPDAYKPFLPASFTTIKVSDLSELGNAKRLVARHGSDIRYCQAWKKWLVWNGKCWEVDDTGAVERCAKETVMSLYEEAARCSDLREQEKIAKHALQSQSAKCIAGTIRLASTEPGIPIKPDHLDKSEWLLNCQNGTINLRTGELLEHRREDLLTKASPASYRPDVACPTWRQFLFDILGGDQELINYVQRGGGYTSTGKTSERTFFIKHGSGRNGKSTFSGIIRRILGDYSRNVAAQTIMKKERHNAISNDIARLQGIRYASVSETQEGMRIDEALMKQLAGGDDVITARFLYGENFDFLATHKLWIATNHRPIITGTDSAIWDRIHLIPFTVRIPDEKIDLDLPLKLEAEMDGILAWLVEGCLEWQKQGLNPPSIVKVATGAYREEMDSLGNFLRDSCIVDETKWVTAESLYRAYCVWADDNGERPVAKARMGERLSHRGFRSERRYILGTQVRCWLGLSLVG